MSASRNDALCSTMMHSSHTTFFLSLGLRVAVVFVGTIPLPIADRHDSNFQTSHT